MATFGKIIGALDKGVGSPNIDNYAKFLEFMLAPDTPNHQIGSHSALFSENSSSNDSKDSAKPEAPILTSSGD